MTTTILVIIDIPQMSSFLLPGFDKCFSPEGSADEIINTILYKFIMRLVKIEF